jgi:uncharacterized protein (DUF362 family)
MSTLNTISAQHQEWLEQYFASEQGRQPTAEELAELAEKLAPALTLLDVIEQRRTA